VYAEKIGYTAGKKYDLNTSESESVKMLSSAAKEAQAWLVGGPHDQIASDETQTIFNA
jgi:omega-amidase